MVGHTFSKLYAIVLHMQLYGERERRLCRARGHASFRLAHQTADHILMLRAIIEETRHRSLKVYYCFVDFRKVFVSVPRVALFQRLREIGIFETLLSAIMRLYESSLHDPGDFKFHKSTIGVK